MAQTFETPDQRLNELITEIAELTGENYVTAMCQALEERRDRLVAGRSAGGPGRLIRLRLEAEIPGELMDLDLDR